MFFYGVGFLEAFRGRYECTSSSFLDLFLRSEINLHFYFPTTIHQTSIINERFYLILMTNRGMGRNASELFFPKNLEKLIKTV